MSLKRDYNALGYRYSGLRHEHTSFDDAILALMMNGSSEYSEEISLTDHFKITNETDQTTTNIQSILQFPCHNTDTHYY